MKTLKEVLNDRGISMAHVAKVNEISPQSLNRYKHFKCLPHGDAVELFEDIENSTICNEKGDWVQEAKYKLVKAFSL